MAKTDTITSYITKIRQVFDDLGATGETVGDHELVRTALNGMTKPWKYLLRGSWHKRIFLSGIVYGTILSRSRFREDICMQDHIRVRRLRRMLLL